MNLCPQISCLPSHLLSGLQIAPIILLFGKSSTKGICQAWQTCYERLEAQSREAVRPFSCTQCNYCATAREIGDSGATLHPSFAFAADQGSSKLYFSTAWRQTFPNPSGVPVFWLQVHPGPLSNLPNLSASPLVLLSLLPRHDKEYSSEAQPRRLMSLWFNGRVPKESNLSLTKHLPSPPTDMNGRCYKSM